MVQIVSDICEIYNAFPNPFPRDCVVGVFGRKHGVKSYILLVSVQLSSCLTCHLPPSYL